MKILAAIEDEEQGRAIAEWIGTRHWPKPTRIRLLKVVPWHPPDRELVYSPALAKYMEEQYQLSLTLITSIKSIIENALPDLQVEVEVLEGSPAERIIATAGAWEADMIIVGANNKKGLTLFLCGSVSSAVVSHASCPVMVFHSGSEGESAKQTGKTQTASLKI